MYIQFFINVFLFSSFNILISLSFSIIYNLTKFFHIAHAVVITLGAYFSYALYKQIELPLWFAIPAAITGATMMGMLTEIVVYRPLRKQGVTPMSMLIASIGLYTLLQNVVSILWGDDAKTIRSGEVTVGNEIFGAYITDTQFVIMFVCLLLFCLTLFFLKFTALGKAIRAVSNNPELCDIYGINANRVILGAFAIGSALGATAGILIAFDTDMTPTFGFRVLLYGTVVMIIGGVGHTKGLIWGALLLATAQHLAGYYIDSKWMEAVAYFILVAFLLWKPLGFSGKRLKKVEI